MHIYICIQPIVIIIIKHSMCMYVCNVCMYVCIYVCMYVCR